MQILQSIYKASEQIALNHCKKKWKRLARDISNKIPQSVVDIPGSMVNKRAGTPKENVGDPKKIRVGRNAEGPEALYTAEVAEQPCRLP